MGQFSPNKSRIGHVMSNLESMGLTQALVCDPMSIWYLTGYYNQPLERFFALHLSADGKGGATSTLFCNKLFPDATGAANAIVTFDDTENPIPLIAAVTKSDKPLGVDRKLVAHWLLPMMDAQIASDFHLASNAVDDARAIKDDAEKDLMREASRINDEAMSWLAAQVHEGVTERKIASGLLAEYRRLGAGDHSFSPIVSFGANAADPHHEPDDTTLKEGECVLIDMGCVYKGYCSDMTRTFVIGQPADPEFTKVHDLVRQANEKAEAIIRPGIPLSTIDAAARDFLAENGYEKEFNHCNCSLIRRMSVVLLH